MRLLKVSLYLAAFLFMGAGFLHLVRPAPFMAIVPPYVPYPRGAVLISGLAEIAGGIGLLVPFTRKAAAVGLVLLLIAVFPANIYMAMHNVQVTARPVPSAALWVRLLFQPVLVWWMWLLRRV